MMAGLEAPPSAAERAARRSPPMSSSRATTSPSRGSQATIAGEAVEGSAQFRYGGEKTRFTLHAECRHRVAAVAARRAGGMAAHAFDRKRCSAPSPRTPPRSGPRAASRLARSRRCRGRHQAATRRRSLSAPPFPVADATLAARVDKEGLTVTDLRGACSAARSRRRDACRRAAPAPSFRRSAELKGGKLEELSKSIAGKGLAKGPFDLALTVQGEGLSPPGLVAGLSGEGTLALGAGLGAGAEPRAAAPRARRHAAQEDQGE